jgi:transcriptional regulator with XRE-family HTH domain
MTTTHKLQLGSPKKRLGKSQRLVNELSAVSMTEPDEQAERAKKIGERIKFARKSILKIDQDTLGRKLGVSGNAVSLWERGNNASGENLRRLAELAGVTLDWLYSGPKGEEHDIYPVEFTRQSTDFPLSILEQFKALPDEDRLDIIEYLRLHLAQAQRKQRPQKK